jgi:hypothetical protein
MGRYGARARSWPMDLRRRNGGGCPTVVVFVAPFFSLRARWSDAEQWSTVRVLVRVRPDQPYHQLTKAGSPNKRTKKTTTMAAGRAADQREQRAKEHKKDSRRRSSRSRGQRPRFHSKTFHSITLNVWHMYGTLNIDKKLITQFIWKQRDKSFKPN